MISKARKVRSLFEHSQQTTSHTYYCNKQGTRRLTLFDDSPTAQQLSSTGHGVSTISQKQTNKQTTNKTKPHPQDTEIAYYSVGSSPVL